MRILLSFQLRLLPPFDEGKKEQAPCLGDVVFSSARHNRL